MNYMKQAAKMLGVEIGEEFELKKDIGDIYRFKIMLDGLFTFSPITEDWHEGNKLLVDLLLGNNEIVKIPQPILDEKEKEYLINIIKPFRNCVTSVTKRNYFNSYEIEYISVTYVDRLIDNSTYIFSLPNFKEGTMYKGMKAGKHYTLEELGL